jgi:fluoroquinolone resistance protein
MEKTKEHRGKVWELKTRVGNYSFKNHDFTNTDFNSAIFENINFIDCLFDKSILSGSKIFGETSVEDCIFKDVNLSNSTIGSNKGLYQNCTFIKCSFQGKEFNFTRFVHCVFDKYVLKKINFNASSFLDCAFIGPMSDVTFNGMYDTNKSDFDTIDKVDFSKATLGDFVTFVECNFSTSIPPDKRNFDDILYQLYSDGTNILSTGSKDRIVMTKK